MRPVVVITDPRYLEHDTGAGHPEAPERMQAIWTRLAAEPLAMHVQQVTPHPAQWEDVCSIHDEAYLSRFEETALSGKSYLSHPDNQLSFESFKVAMLAAGAGLTGVDLLEKGEAKLIFCAVRPPGHHAERRLAMGFCFINNVAIAARYWQKTYQRQRVLIIDWDAHHGNGIQAAFEEDPTVLYISIHEHPTFSFPGTGYAEETGTGPGIGATLNIPLPPGADDAMVRTALSQQVEPVVAKFEPQALIVAAGFDGHRRDDMSGLAYSTDLYMHLGTLMAGWGKKYCGGKVLSILEGGYEKESLAASVEAYLIGLLRTTSNQQQTIHDQAGRPT